MNIHPATVTASDLKGASWFKSSYSNGGGNCVEIARGVHGTVPVRDSKVLHGPAILFTPSAFSSFVAAVQQRKLEEN